MFYLVTKEWFNSKPTYQAMWDILHKLNVWPIAKKLQKLIILRNVLKNIFQVTSPRRPTATATYIFSYDLLKLRQLDSMFRDVMKGVTGLIPRVGDTVSA